jgi:hypothetical protein
MRYRPGLSSYRYGAYSAHELLVFLERTRTQEDMAAKGFGSVRTLREISNRLHEPLDCRALYREFFLLADPPISEGWDREIAELRELNDLALPPDDDKKRGDALAIERLNAIGRATMSRHEILGLKLAIQRLLRSKKVGITIDREELKHLVGKGYYAATYYRLRALLANKDDFRGREWKNNQRIAATIYKFVFKLLVAGGEEKTQSGSTLAFKATLNGIAMIWNITSPPRRDSRRMRRLVHASGHLERLKSYAREHLAERQYALNALAIASRLGLRSEYKELHQLLIDADSAYAEPEKLRDSGKTSSLDDDFDDFFAWRKECPS